MERSLFFGSIGGDRRYVSNDYAKWIGFFYTDGVAPTPATALQVGAGSGLSVTVAPGGCKAGGRIGINEAAATIPMSLSDGSYDRYDRIVIRCNYADRIMQLLAIAGEPDIAPVPPAVVRSDDMHDLGIGVVRVAKGAASITAADITDTRFDADVCGLCTALVPLDTTEVFAQYAAIFGDFMDGVRDALADDAAGNLLNLINYHAPATLTASLPASGWSAAAPYTQTVAVAGLLATDTPLADVVLSDTAATATAQLEAYGLLGRLDTGSGQITATCYEDKPGEDLTLQLKVVR